LFLYDIGALEHHSSGKRTALFEDEVRSKSNLITLLLLLKSAPAVGQLSQSTFLGGPHINEDAPEHEIIAVRGVLIFDSVSNEAMVPA